MPYMDGMGIAIQNNHEGKYTTIVPWDVPWDPVTPTCAEANQPLRLVT